MKRTILSALCTLAVIGAKAQTLNVRVGQVTYQIPAEQAGQMPYTFDAAATTSMVGTLTILNKVFPIHDIDEMYVDQTEVLDDAVGVTYDGDAAAVTVSGNIAAHLTVNVQGAHVSIVQDDAVTSEIVYTLSGESQNGSFYMDGQFKTSLVLAGLTLHNPDSAAINIRDGKRISVELAAGTVNTLSDGQGGQQKACFMVKGHTEFKDPGQLYITGNTAHAFWGKEYVEVKKTCGGVYVKGAVGDGFNVNQYFQMNGGTVGIEDVGDDAIQVSYKTDDDGTVETDAENTGSILIKGGTLTVNIDGAATKALKTAGDLNIQDGSVSITQTGTISQSDTDISYPTSLRSEADVNISGGTLTIVNTADGGKGISAEGAVNISGGTLDITANGAGGTAETAGTGDTTTATYKIYVSLPTSGGGGGGMGPGGGSNAWTTLYLYKSDGTLVQQLTTTATLSNGYSTTTFYTYDFAAPGDGTTYYLQSDNYSSRNGTTYTIRTTTFAAPTTGTDIYYSITSSYTTSGNVRTYSITNVTNNYSGTTETSEDQGTAYNAAGIKADGDLTIQGGIVTVENNGAMSKSIKSKATVTISGGTVTLKPSGQMKVINNDASYSSGIKAIDFVQNDGSTTITASGSASRGISATTITTDGGTLTITNSAGGVSGTSDDYTAKGLLADTSIALNGGNITISMTGDGGKGIKSKGNYTQGLADGSGPTLTVTTTGSRFGTSGSTGGGNPWGGGWQQESSGGSAKAIKIQGSAQLFGGTTHITTATDGAEGLETKQGNITISGGHHYIKTYDDCINTAYQIFFNGGITICYSNGNDAIDSNYGRSGAITIGDGCVVAFTTRGSPEEAFDCDNNSYITINGSGYAVGAGASQGGGGGWGGSSSSIGSASQGYALLTSTLSYTADRYYAIMSSNVTSGTPLLTYSFPVGVSSSLSLLTAKGMTRGSTYYLKSTTTAPADATDSFQGIYLGAENLSGLENLTNFTAQ